MLSTPRIVLSVVVCALAAIGCPDGRPGNIDEPATGPGEKTEDDLDGDGIPNSEDPDIDGDGIPNASDHDMDGDGIPNELDDDIDGDGIPNDEDDTPFGPPGGVGPWADPDGDGIPNIFDNDDDGDGIPDGVIGPGSCDGGLTVVTDENADCDGYCIDVEAGLVPCDDGGVPGTGFPDTDGDGIPDILDEDDDNDGIPDGQDTNPRGDDPCVGLEGPPPAICFEEPGEGEGEGEPQPTCATQTFDPADPLPARILMVVDRSGSMNEAVSGFAGFCGGITDQTACTNAGCSFEVATSRCGSKWDAAKEALIGPPNNANGGVIGQLAPTTEFGLFMYPAGSGQQNQCTAGTVQDGDGVALNNFNNIRGGMRNTTPAGGTPTAPALLAARAELGRLPAQGGQRAVILVTDGGPNCNTSLNGATCRCVAAQEQCQNFSANCLDDVNTIAAANQLNQSGFPVFVLGIDGALAFGDVLTRTAQAGGTGNFFSIGSAQNLAQTIEDIALRVGACRFELNGAPTANQLTVAVDGTAVNRDTNRQNGWDLLGVSTIELFGAACQAAQQATQNVSVQTCF